MTPRYEGIGKKGKIGMTNDELAIEVKRLQARVEGDKKSPWDNAAVMDRAMERS
jgi:hypothetical protein